jgi:hypothetical protein
MDPEALFTAATLALGPAPRDESSPEMTRYQLDLLAFCKEAGVKYLDDREFRRMLLTWFFIWETEQQKRIDTHIV